MPSELRWWGGRGPYLPQRHMFKLNTWAFTLVIPPPPQLFSVCFLSSVAEAVSCSLTKLCLHLLHPEGCWQNIGFADFSLDGSVRHSVDIAGVKTNTGESVWSGQLGRGKQTSWVCCGFRPLKNLYRCLLTRGLKDFENKKKEHTHTHT